MLSILKNILSNPKHYLTPTYHLPSILQIQQYKHLKGIKYIIFDKDDTLTFLKSNEVLPKFQDKLASLNNNYKCFIVSNGKNNPDQIQGIPILKTIQKKPYNFQEIQKHIKQTETVKGSSSSYHKDELVVIGDRLLTDIYMANTNGVKSILVDKLQNSTVDKHGAAVVVLRKLESLALSIIRKQQ